MSAKYSLLELIPDVPDKWLLRMLERAKNGPLHFVLKQIHYHSGLMTLLSRVSPVQLDEFCREFTEGSMMSALTTFSQIHASKPFNMETYRELLMWRQLGAYNLRKKYGLFEDHRQLGYLRTAIHFSMTGELPPQTEWFQTPKRFSRVLKPFDVSSKRHNFGQIDKLVELGF